jgi:hypothetical protein
MEPMLESSNESKRPRRSSGLLFMFEAIVWQPTKSQRASRYICIIAITRRLDCKHERGFLMLQALIDTNITGAPPLWPQMLVV